jgi:hypothetical protein
MESDDTILNAEICNSASRIVSGAADGKRTGCLNSIAEFAHDIRGKSLCPPVGD